MTKQDFLALLADNQMQQLFSELKNRQDRYHSDLILLESQWSDLQTRERNGTLSHDQSNLEAARIRKNLLDLIDRSFGSRPAVQAPALPAVRWASPRTWMMVGAALAIVVVAWLAFQPADATGPAIPQMANEAGSKPSISPAATSVNAAASGQAKKLEVPSNPITINKGRIGDLTLKFLSAELSEQNPTTWSLHLHLRAIKPAYGSLVNGSRLHIVYGDFEKGPVAVDFAYVNPGETIDGTMEFEIPKEYREAKILFYHYNDEPPLASIPFHW